MYDDLIALAGQLASLDRAKPKQAHLRRAVSTAYYAVFHYLVDAACRLQIGGQHSQRGFRYALSRAFNHTTMKAACGSFGGGTLPQAIVNAISGSTAGTYQIPKEIQNIAALFKELQEKRHMADYDLAIRFKRSEVQSLIDEVQANIEAFDQLKTTDDRSFFLACLWSWKELQAR